MPFGADELAATPERQRAFQPIDSGVAFKKI
jgi:hypothetical protein